MNRLFVLLALVLGTYAATGYGAAQAQETRIAYVNSQFLLQNAPGVAEARAELDRRTAPYVTEMQGLETELDTLQVQFERQQATMPAATREQRLQELQDKLAHYQQRGQQIQQQVQQWEQELIAPLRLEERILAAVESVRAEGNYTLVIDQASGALMAADPTINLTDQVLARMSQTNP